MIWYLSTVAAVAADSQAMCWINVIKSIQQTEQNTENKKPFRINRVVAVFGVYCIQIAIFTISSINHFSVKILEVQTAAEPLLAASIFATILFVSRDRIKFHRWPINLVTDFQRKICRFSPFLFTTGVSMDIGYGQWFFCVVAKHLCIEVFPHP